MPWPAMAARAGPVPSLRAGCAAGSCGAGGFFAASATGSAAMHSAKIAREKMARGWRFIFVVPFVRAAKSHERSAEALAGECAFQIREMSADIVAEAYRVRKAGRTLGC